MEERCPWPGDDALYIQYHDTEWGVPEHDSKMLWEKLTLEGFQAGLSWITILKKRESFRKAFDNFQPEIVATYDELKITTLLQNKDIIRHRGKIEATVQNAKKFLAKGDKVKFTVQFKGRAMQHTNLGYNLMNRIINDTSTLGKVEVRPKFEGRQIIMIIQSL